MKAVIAGAVALAILGLGGCEALRSNPRFDPGWWDKSCGEIRAQFDVLEDRISAKKKRYALKQVGQASGAIVTILLGSIYGAVALPIVGLLDSNWSSERDERLYLSTIYSAKRCHEGEPQ